MVTRFHHIASVRNLWFHFWFSSFLLWSCLFCLSCMFLPHARSPSHIRTVLLWYGSHHQHIFCSLQTWLSMQFDVVFNVFLKPSQIAFNTHRMLLLLLFLHLPGPPILTIFSNGCTGSRYKNTLNTKLFLPRISSSSLLLNIACTISSHSSLRDPLDHPHWSFFSKHQLTPVSWSQTTLSSMPHLTCRTSLRVPYQSGPPLSSASPSPLWSSMIPDHLLTFLMTFSTIVLKASFFQNLFLYRHLSCLRLISRNAITRCFDSHSLVA